MIDPVLLIEGFRRNGWIIGAQTEGLTHADSLLQTDYRINCLNWTLGHVLDGRGVVLELLGCERIVAAADTDRYRSESDPVTGDGPGVLPLEALTDGIERSGEAIVAALGTLDAAALAEESDAGDAEGVALGAHLHAQYFHETYHTGQTELLRQVTGVGDKVI